MKPSNFLYFPIRKDGSFLIDSQGKPRVYKSAKMAFKNLKTHEYAAVMIYAVDDIVSREEFEKAVRSDEKETQVL